MKYREALVSDLPANEGLYYMNQYPKTSRKTLMLIWPAGLFLFFFLNIPPTLAQEIHVAGGVINRNDDGEKSYSWLISYFEGINEHFAWSLSWLNEGHLPDHHRDGPSVQFWGRKYLLDQRLSLAVGAGPYFAFDSNREGMAGDNYENVHKLGGLFSLTATWYMKTRWLLQTRLENVWMDGDMDTTSILLGVGYHFPTPEETEETERSASKKQAYRNTKNEINLSLGYTNINGPAENDFAASVQYRRSIFRYLDWSVGWIHEIDTAKVDRQGLTTQFWGTKSFFGDRLGLGAGFGIYFFKDDANDPQSGIDDNLRAGGLITLSASYQLPWQWVLRGSWIRVITDYDRDSDVFLFGLGYQF